MDESDWKVSGNCTCLREREGAYLAESFADIPQSVLSRLNLTAKESCCNGSGTESCQNSPSGTMLKPLTENHGEEKLTSCAADFPAKTLATLERKKELPENEVDFGKKCGEWFAKYDRIMCSWKIRQLWLFADLDTSLEIWPRWGMMRNGECFRLPMLEHDTSVQDGGALLTVTKFDSHYSPNSAANNTLTMWAKSLGIGVARDGILLGIAPEAKGTILNPCFCESLMLWPNRWTALQPLEMGKFQAWLRSHGKS